MWILTNFGFFSVVQKPGDKAAGLITVRSRVRADLENLRDRYLPDMGVIEEDAGTDYRYRARVPHQSFAQAAKKIALDVDYSNPRWPLQNPPPVARSKSPTPGDSMTVIY
jgi:hypothetical protein